MFVDVEKEENRCSDGALRPSMWQLAPYVYLENISAVGRVVSGVDANGHCLS